jgi:hypothetical protein
MRRTLALLAVLTAVTFGACGSDDDDNATEATTTSVSTDATSGSGPTTTLDEVQQPWSREQRAHVEVTVKGDEKFTWDDDVNLRVLTFRPTGQAEDLSLLSVGLQSFISLGGSDQFRAAFDLAGSYTGPKTYKIAKGSGSVTGTTANAQTPQGINLSNAFVVWVRLKDPAAPLSGENLEVGKEFNRVKKECTIKVADKLVRSGSLDCPELENEKTGDTVSLKMTWSPPKS